MNVRVCVKTRLPGLAERVEAKPTIRGLSLVSAEFPRLGEWGRRPNS